MLMSLRTDDEKILLDLDGNRWPGRFWTEHSSRSTLISLARSLGTPKDITDRLGWWASKVQASELYVRTYRSSAAKVQCCVATFVRAAKAASILRTPFPDFFDEEAVLEALKIYNDKHSPTAEAFEASRLRVFDRASKLDRKSLEARYSWQTNTAKEGEADEGAPTTSSEEEAPPGKSLPSVGTPARLLR